MYPDNLYDHYSCDYSRVRFLLSIVYTRFTFDSKRETDTTFIHRRSILESFAIRYLAKYTYIAHTYGTCREGKGKTKDESVSAENGISMYSTYAFRQVVNTIVGTTRTAM